MDAPCMRYIYQAHIILLSMGWLIQNLSGHGIVHDHDGGVRKGLSTTSLHTSQKRLLVSPSIQHTYTLHYKRWTINNMITPARSQKWVLKVQNGFPFLSSFILHPFTLLTLFMLHIIASCSNLSALHSKPLFSGIW